MSWPKRRKADPRGKTLMNEVSGEVRRLLNNRRRLLAPFIIDPKDLYRLLWTDREWTALQLLQESTNRLFQRERWLYIHGTPGVMRGQKITVYMPELLPFGGRDSLNHDDLPEPMQVALKEWAPKWREMHNQTERICEEIGRVGNVCVTYGHAARIWPDLIGFFHQSARQALNNAVVRSRYPDECMDWENGRRVRVNPEYAPEKFEPWSIVLAEALMLPEVDGDEIASVD